MRFSLLVDECDLLKRQIVNGGVCSGKTAQQLAHASKDDGISINDLSHCTAYAQKAAQEILCSKSVALVERLQTFSQQEAATFSESVGEAARDAVTSLERDVAHCQATV